MYCLIEAKIKDTAKFQEYVTGHLPSIHKYGGRIAARSISPHVVMGENNNDVIVIHEWPDRSAFMSWFQSQDYTQWIPVREQACDLRIILLE